MILVLKLLYKSMALDLAEINNIEGVTESYVYSHGGALITPQLPFKDARIEHMGREVALCSAILEKIEHAVDFYELIYQEMRIIVRISHNCFILVVCESTADTTLIKLRLNVLHEELKGDTDLQKSLRKLPGKGNLLAEAQAESDLQDLFKKIKITA
jgi:hypothetical protein